MEQTCLAVDGQLEQIVPPIALKPLRRGIDDFQIAFSALQSACIDMQKAMQRFGDDWYGMAERSYLQKHSRLPGGTRTARLRKKRRTKVLAWFSELLLASCWRMPKRPNVVVSGPL